MEIAFFFEITKNEDFLITANENIIAVRDFNTFDEMLYFKNHSARVNHIWIYGICTTLFMLFG